MVRLQDSKGERGGQSGHVRQHIEKQGQGRGGRGQRGTEPRLRKRKGGDSRYGAGRLAGGRAQQGWSVMAKRGKSRIVKYDEQRAEA